MTNFGSLAMDKFSEKESSDEASTPNQQEEKSIVEILSDIQKLK